MDEDSVKKALQNAKTVKIKDAYGNEIKYTAKEAQDAGLNLSTMYSNKTTPIYPTNSGGFTNDQYSTDIKTTITLNKDTGKITVMAPEYVTNRTEYKEQILPQLEDLSAAYKQDPDQKIASATDDDTEYSIEEWVSRIQDAIADSDYMSQAASIDQMNTKMQNIGYSDWTDTESSIALYGNNEAMSDEANDYTRVYVSDFGDANYFKNMDSFDESTNTISLADFKKWWNREERDDSEILDDYRLITELGQEPNATVSGGNANETARRMALANLVENTDPEMSAWQDLADDTATIVMSVVDGLAGWAFDIADAVDGDGETFASKYRSGSETWFENEAILNRGTAISHVVGEIGSLFVPLGAVGKGLGAAAKATKGATVGKLITKAGELTKTAEELTTLSKAMSEAKTAAEVSKAAKGMSKVLETVKAEKVVSGLSASLKLAKGTDAVKVVEKAFATSKALSAIAQSERAIAKIGNTAINLAQFTADSVIGSLLVDEDLRNKILDNDVDGTVSEEIMTNLAVDALFYGGIKGATKGITKLGDTKVGQAMSLNAARRLAGIDYTFAKAKNGLKTLVLRADEAARIEKLVDKGTEGSIKKATALQANQRILRAKKALAEEDKISWILGREDETIEEGIERVRSSKLIKVEEVNNAIDKCQRNITGMIREAIYGTKGNKAAYNDMISSARKLAKAEKAAGRKVGKMVKGVEGEGISRMSAETSNYINARNRMTILGNKGGDVSEMKGYPKKLSAEEGKSYLDAKAQVEKFIKSTEKLPEVREAANEYYGALRTFYKQFVDYFSTKGGFSKTELESLAETGYWGDARDEYIRTQRVKESNVKISSKKKNLSTKFQKLQSGTGDFVDPTLVAANWMAQVCDNINRQNAAKLLFDPSTDVVLADGTKTAATIKASHKAQNTFHRDFNVEALDTFINDIEDDTFDVLKKAIEGKKDIRKQAKATEKAFSKGLKTKGKTYYASSAAERTIYINELSTEKFNEIVNGTVGYTTPTEAVNELIESGMTQEDAFKTWLESIPNKTKKSLENEIITQLEAQGYDFSELLSKNRSKAAEDISVLTPENYQMMRDGDGLFERRIMNSLIADNKEYRDSDIVTNAISDEKYNYELYQARVKYAKEKATLDKLQAEYGMTAESGWAEGELYDLIREEIGADLDELAKKLMGHNKGKTFQAVLDVAETEGDDAKEFLAYKYLTGKKTKQNILKKFEDLSDKWFSKHVDGTKMNQVAYEKSRKEFTNTISKMLEGEIDSRFDRLNQLMVDTKNPLKDQNYIFDNVNKLIHKIEGWRKEDNVVPIGTRNGEIEYVRLDPLSASIVRSNANIDAATGSMFKDISYITNKIFRLNTTGLRLASWITQTFRDAIPLYSGVGAMTTLGRAMESMTDNFGESFLRHLREFDAKAYEDAIKEFKASGKVGDDLKEAIQKYAVEQTNVVGQGYSSSATETVAQQYSRREVKAKEDLNIEDQRRLTRRLSNAIDGIISNKYITVRGKKMINPLSLNQRREEYMRKLAYTNTLNNALKKGYSLPDAMTHATFMMNNATTNFSRITVHLNTMQKTVPYLGAAINGTKSFYRMLELDPVGVLGRLYGGIILPTMALTAYSLANEENRKVYRNIPEYEKQDNICFVIEGQVLEIPIPQEMAPIFGIGRAFVEKLYDGANIHTFWELAANDVLGLSPIDLQGFLNIDSKTIYTDDAEHFWDNMETGFVKMLAGLMSPIEKTTVMLATGKDPYTGRAINTAYETYDQDTGETYVMDYYSSEFAKKVAGIFGQEVNAWMAQVILNNIIGKATSQVLEDLTSLANGVQPSAIIEDVSGVFTAEVYDMAQTAWSTTLKQLQAEKDEIVNSKEYQSAKDAVTYSNGDETKKQNGIKKQQELLQPLYEKTLNVVEQLNSKYGAQFTSKKYAAVINLFNTAEETPVQTTSNYLSGEAQDIFYAGRNAAIETMANMGFVSPNDGSIFGYVKKSSDGGYTFAYRDPVAILAYDQLSSAQTDIHTANIEAALKAAGLTTSVMWDGYYDLTTSAQKKAYKSLWNKQVVAALEPYVEKYGVDAVVRNSNMVDLLDNYIFVSNPYTAKSYIKSLFEEE